MHMTQLQCPECRGTIDEKDLFDGSCSYCGATLNQLRDPSVSDPNEIDNNQEAGFWYGEQPSDSYIQIVELSEDRLVMHFPTRANSATALGIFSLCWNVFVGIFSIFFLAAAGGQVGIPFALSFLGIFWLISFSMTYFWFRLKYTKVNLFLDSERLVVQKICGWKKWITEITLDANSKAILKQAFRQNGSLVYSLEVTGMGTTISWGTGLSIEDKHWVKSTINSFLGQIDESPDIPAKLATSHFLGKVQCTHCGVAITDPELNRSLETAICPQCDQPVLSPEVQAQITKPIDNLSPNDIPQSSLVSIEDSHSDRLQLRFPLLVGKSKRVVSVIGLFLVTFLTAPLLGLALILWRKNVNLGGLSLIQVLFALSFWVLVMLVIRAGKIALHLNDQTLKVQYGWKIVQVQRVIPLESIEKVSILPLTVSSKRSVQMKDQSEQELSQAGDHVFCQLFYRKGSQPKSLPLTLFHGSEMAREVAGLVQGWIQKQRG